MKEITTLTVEKKDMKILKKIALHQDLMYYEAFAKMVEREAERLKLC